LGLYLSAEMDTGTGSMIALVSAVIFAVVATSKLILSNAFATQVYSSKEV